MDITRNSDAADIIDAARLGVQHEIIDPDTVYAFVKADGSRQIIDGRDYAGRPDRKRGAVSAFDAETFAAYVNAHDDSDAARVWVDEQNLRAVGVLNGHMGDGGPAGFGDHTVSLILRPTEAWQAWAALDGKMATQQDLAEHIEDNAADIADPAAAIMLQVAQSIEGTSRATFKSSNRLDNGQRGFVYETAVEAKAGTRGELIIPAEFTLGIRPFYGSPPYKLTARFRYRIDGDGHLRIGYKLVRPDDVRRSAFGDIINDIAAALPEGIMYAGKPS